MDCDSIVYNVKIYSLSAKRKIYRTMFSKIGFVTALFEGQTPNEDVNVKELIEVKDARRLIMLPPFVHYTDDLTFDMLVSASPFNCRDITRGRNRHITKDAFIKALKKIELLSKAKEPYVIYNFDRDMLSGCEIPAKEDIAAVFKNKSFALFDKEKKYCVISDKLMKSMGMAEGESGYLSDETYALKKQAVLKALIATRPNMLSNGVFAFLREAKKYGIKAIITEQNDKLTDFVVNHINTNFPIKAYITENHVSGAVSGIFPAYPFEDLNPFKRLHKMITCGKITSLFETLKLYCGREFGISDIAGEIKKGVSCDYIILSVDIFDTKEEQFKDCSVKEFVINGSVPKLDNSISIYLKMFRNLSKLKEKEA